MITILVVGYKGEIGSALFDIIKHSKKYNVFGIDVGDNIKGIIDIMHICIPYSDSFKNIVKDYIDQYHPKLTIINSTVRVGTTKALSYYNVVHSPVRGKHPDIKDGLLKAVKFIGSDNAKLGNLAKEHFQKLGINTEIISPIESELGKLFSTTYYALCIAYHQEMKRICDNFGADFDKTVTRFNETYNELCKETNPKVVRPVLFAGVIGGHCLMPNISLLKEDIESDFLNIIEKSNEKQ